MYCRRFKVIQQPGAAVRCRLVGEVGRGEPRGGGVVGRLSRDLARNEGPPQLLRQRGVTMPARVHQRQAQLPHGVARRDVVVQLGGAQEPIFQLGHVVLHFGKLDTHSVGAHPRRVGGVRGPVGGQAPCSVGRRVAERTPCGRESLEVAEASLLQFRHCQKVLELPHFLRVVGDVALLRGARRRVARADEVADAVADGGAVFRGGQLLHQSGGRGMIVVHDVVPPEQRRVYTPKVRRDAAARQSEESALVELSCRLEHAFYKRRRQVRPQRSLAQRHVRGI
mmetsp:Transcript_19359/g.65388  ORF Transcript_19359/g.65388 Transcript_19359/m.65388 type:complete len:281 (+) Transcript_19359:462-1304(+)